MTVILAGIALGFSLIISLGPQNIFLIKQGVKRDSIGAIVAVCLLSDVALFIMAVTGVGALIQRAPLALEVLRWVGVAYLGWFAVQAFRDAARPGKDAVEVVDTREPVAEHGAVAVKTRTAARRKLAAPVGTALMLTWANPNTWVDGVVIGGIANQYGDSDRWLFIVGALIVSAVWFPLIGYGTAALSRPLSSPRVWRVLNVVIGAVLSVLAVKLALL